jgi:hypothetical protein
VPSNGSSSSKAATRAAGEELFARNVRVLRLEASAWLAHLSGQQESSVATMREAGGPRDCDTQGARDARADDPGVRSCWATC